MDKSYKTQNEEKKVSICEVMKSDSSRLIQKLESQIPLNFQESSVLYTTYLHTLDNIFGTCYIAEQEFFDKLNIDQRLLLYYKKNSNSLTDAYLNQIENYYKFRQINIQIQMSLLESCNEFFKNMMDSYSRLLSQFTNFFNFTNPK